MTELRFDVVERSAWLTLDGPKNKNALSPALLETLMEHCAALARRDDVHVVVVRGANGTFSAGADPMRFMARMRGEQAEDGADLGRRASEALSALPQVTIAAIEGYCVGGGLVLAACCDIRWAARESRFIIPEVALGIPLGWGALPRLVALVGETATTDLVLTCRRFDVEEALRIGLVSATFDGDDLHERVATIASRPAGVLRTTKTQLAAIRGGTFEPRADARALITALNDPESQRAAQNYIARRFRKKR